MEINIVRADYELAKEANKLLTDLIVDEKKYDENINEECVVRSLYENFYKNEDVCLLLAKENNNIAGYLYGFIQNNGDAKKDLVITLDALFVKQEYRNYKIATKLIKEFKNWCLEKNAKYIELKVCKDNLAAVSLYENNGFATNKIIMSCKRGGEDETF